MKKIVLSITLFLFTALTVVAQGMDRNKIQALKRAHITNALNLSSSEAEKFWPIYNEFNQRIHKMKILKTRTLMRRIRLAGGINSLSEEEADIVLREYIEIDYNIATEKKKLYKDLTGIISSKKMIKLLRAEQSFNKELLKRLREKRLKRN